MKLITKILGVAAVALSANALALDAIKVMVPANPGGGWDSTGARTR